MRAWLVRIYIVADGVLDVGFEINLVSAVCPRANLLTKQLGDGQMLVIGIDGGN